MAASPKAVKAAAEAAARFAPRAKVNIFGYEPGWWRWITIGLTGVTIGWYVEQEERERASTYRNKSQLYGRELKEGEDLPWGSPIRDYLPKP